MQHNNFGGNVARTVFKSMLTAVLDRMPDYQCTAEGTVHYDSIGVIQGMRHLHAIFTPGPTSGPGVGKRYNGCRKACDDQGLARPITELKESAKIPTRRTSRYHDHMRGDLRCPTTAPLRW